MEITEHSRPWAGDSTFRMIDVSEKAATRRRAVARGTIRVAPDAFRAIRENTNPKGNVLALAEVAGIMAAKKTADTLPLCHPLPLQSVRFSFELDAENSCVHARCEVITSAQTGVEMEALTGIHAALLGIYDLSKAVNPEISITDVRLDFKEGGKTGIWKHPQYRESPATREAATRELADVPVAVITVSDRVFAGKARDRSGPAVSSQFKEWGAKITAELIVPDETAEIQSAVRRAIETHRFEASLVVLTGGTGLSPRDVTPEALTKLADRIIPGVGECLRASGARHIDTAWLSRSMGCLIGKTWVIALPGSEKAVREGLDALRPLLAHGLHTLNGAGHETAGARK